MSIFAGPVERAVDGILHPGCAGFDKPGTSFMGLVLDSGIQPVRIRWTMAVSIITMRLRLSQVFP
jgi:hypothetical protein